MNAGQVLRASEASALDNNQFISNVTGKIAGSKDSKKHGSFSAAAFITAMIVFFVFIFSSGNLIPSALSERLIEETDVQYADAVESKKLVFQQALQNGDIPQDTAKVLKDNNVLVGYVDGGEFIEAIQHDGGLVLKIDDRIITAADFIKEVGSDIRLYDAFNKATYSRAAYYYDESAKKVFQKIGTNRNNYNSDSDFDEVMEKMVGSGSSIDVNNVALVRKTRTNEQTGKEEVYYVYEEVGGDANSGNSADAFVDEVRAKNPASNATESALYSADALKVADTVSKEQRSSLFFLTFMENVSKMKAGDGNESKINEAMNYLYESSETEVLDVNTGEIVKTTGTALESPSLYAVLSGEKIDASKVANYSSDRILKTVENKVNASDSSIIGNTVASSANKTRGSIGRFINNSVETASQALLSVVNPTVSSSLMENSYSTIKGVNAGEFLVEGAINVGKELAKASGATAGDSAAVLAYVRLNNDVLAMDAKIDRMNRSPFDITSRNTFLGSIVYKVAMFSAKTSGTLMSGVKNFGSLLTKSLISFLPSSYADSAEGYLSTFGDCETYSTIGAVGSAQCSEIATFDVSTLNNPFNDSGFVQFINSNTTLDVSGNRTVKQNSDLSNFILYNDERTTPLGVMDGGILESLSSGSSSIPFLTNILEMIKTFLGASETEKRIASGAAFVNSSNNTDWQTYKYAQRYVSLARATSALRQYAGSSTAYSNIQFLEGNENPIAVFLEEYYAMK